jgi:hypothetical protein
MITPSFGLTATERVLPRLALDFTTASLDSRVTFTRSGNTASVVNSSGYVAPINADLPRFDYDPVTKICKGLLIEEARTNLALGSEAFNVLPWVLTRATIGSTTEITPANSANAEKLTLNTSVSTTHYVAQTIATTAVSVAFSIYAKAAELNGLYLWSQSISGGVFFNLIAGTVGGAQAGASGQIFDAGNGWYRCVLYVTASSGTTTFRVYLANNGLNTMVGDGASGVYIWGAQLETGAFATSYIPTEASQVTRTADVATMTGTNFSDWYSAGVGGLVARVLPSTVSGTRPALQFDDATANEVITLRGNTTNPELVIVDGGASQAQIDAGTIAANTAYNLGAAWNTDNCAAAVNGGAAVTDTTATIPTVTQARLGSDGTNYLNGQIQTVRYWPQRIIDAEVQAFSK